MPQMLYPNAITPHKKEVGNWTVKPLRWGMDTGNTDPKGKVVYLPSGTEHDDGTAIHEACHVRWTPRKERPNYSPADEEVQVTEDARIQSLLSVHYPDGWEVLKADGLSSAEKMLVAMQGGKHWKPGTPEAQHGIACFSVCYAPDRDTQQVLVDTAVKLGYMDERIGRHLIAYTQRLTEYCQYHMAYPADKELEHAMWDAADSLVAFLKGLQPDEPGKGKGKPGESTEEGEADTPGKGPLQTGRGKWGTCKVEQAKLDKAITPKQSKFKAGEFGALNKVERLLTDGQAFREKRRANQGSVLIDCSGSMSPDSEMLAAIVKACSAATIALYASDADTMASGKVVIVGKDGKVASSIEQVRETHGMGGGNVVDGPALDWLGHQSGPRLWVCDGHVTGVGDASSPYCKAAASTLQRQYGIKRIDSLEQALAILKSGKQVGA